MRVAHRHRRAVFALFLRGKTVGGIGAPLHGLTVERPDILRIEGVYHVERHEADGAACGDVVLGPLERPAERHIFGRSDPHGKLDGIRPVFVRGRETQGIGPGLGAPEGIVPLRRNLPAVHAPRVGDGDRDFGHGRFQHQIGIREDREALLRTGNRNGRHFERRHVHAQFLARRTVPGRNLQQHVNLPDGLRAEDERRLLSDHPAVHRPTETGVVGVLVTGADGQFAPRLHRVHARFAVERDDGSRRRIRLDNPVPVAGGERRQKKAEQRDHGFSHRTAHIICRAIPTCNDRRSRCPPGSRPSARSRRNGSPEPAKRPRRRTRRYSNSRNSTCRPTVFRSSDAGP